MGLVLSFIAGFLFCITSWGSLVAFCIGKRSLAIIGILLFVGILALSYIVAAIYWILSEIEHRAKTRSEIMSISDEKHRAVIERDLAAEKWYDPLIGAAMMLAFIVGYGVLSPIYLVIDALEWFVEQISKLFSTTLA